jgi:hypothetical protein
MTQGKEKILEIERGSTRWHPMQNSLWKRLRTCRKTDYRLNDGLYFLPNLIMVTKLKTVKYGEHIAPVERIEKYVEF